VKSIITSKILLALFIVCAFILAIGCGGDSNESANGELIVVSEPPMKAKIEINGKDTGKVTDATFSDLAPGEYEITLFKENPERKDLPFIGEAKVTVEAGKKKRVTVVLNVMSVQPRRQAQSRIIAETEGQKSVIDFYAAINEKDFATAYGLLDSKQKKGYRSFRNFTKIWKNVSGVSLISLLPKKLPDGESLIEEDVIETTITYEPIKGRAPTIPPIAVQADPKEVPVQKWLIKTEGDIKDPSDVWKITDISKEQ